MFEMISLQHLLIHFAYLYLTLASLSELSFSQGLKQNQCQHRYIEEYLLFRKKLKLLMVSQS